MKKIGFIIFFLCYVSVIGQEINYFNRVYQSDTNGISSVAIKPFNNNYILLGGFNWLGGYSHFYTREINELGENVNVNVIDSGVFFSTTYFGNCLEYTHDNNLIMSGLRGITQFDGDYVLIKFTADGTVIWNKQYEEEGWQSNAQVIVCKEGGFLLTGFSQLLEPDIEPAQVYLIRTNEESDTLWTQKHSAYTDILYSEQTSDGGFLLSGYQLNSDTGYDMYVLKTNNSGDMEWERTYGTDQHDGGCRVRQLPNGNYLLLGLINNGIGTISELAFIIFDESGQIIVEKHHAKNETHSPSGIPQITTDNRIITATLSHGFLGPWEIAFTVFDIEGNIIIDELISSGLGGQDYIRDIEPTSDGGYVLAGFNYTTPQRSWVIKVDSLGQSCGIAPCDSTVITSSVGNLSHPIHQRHIRISPNPASHQCVLHYELPPHHPMALLEIYNQQGQKVQQQQLSGAFREQSIDISKLPSGIYVYQIVLPGKVLFSDKLVVQR